MTALDIASALRLRRGHSLAIFAFGSMVYSCLPIAERLDASLFNMRFVKPLDRETILHAAGEHSYVVTVEENAVAGGAGSGVNEVLASAALTLPVLNIGLGDSYIEHGTREECLQRAGLDEAGILRQINDFLENLQSSLATRSPAAQLIR